MKREQMRRRLASVVIGLLALGSTAACQRAGGDGEVFGLSYLDREFAQIDP
jgi:hypothetical protein